MRVVLRREMPKEHKPQMQGNLWILRRTDAWFGSFDPRLIDNEHGAEPLVMLHYRRDDEYIADELKPAVMRFKERYLYELAKLTKAPF